MLKKVDKHQSEDKIDALELADAVLDSLSEQIAIIDPDWTITTVNKAWKKFAEKNKGQIIDRAPAGADYFNVCREYSLKDKRFASILKNIKSVLNGSRDKFSTEYSRELKKKREWFLLSVTALKTDGVISGAVVSHTNITRRKEAELESRRLAVTDSMTGILNRKAGLDFINSRLKYCRKHHTSLTVCYIDLDNLKQVNDNFGHKEGDRVIKTAVRAIKSVLRTNDEVCRMGGDEILIILPDTSIDDAKAVIERIIRRIDEKNESSNKPYKVNFSYGLAEYNPKNKCSAEELVHQADSNMYEMKSSKKKESTGSYG
ncbi:MAG: diguanylate cyclase [Deltaproteobacteria bacterium]